MAKMYPPEFVSGPRSEKRVYDALIALPSSWHVVHDVAFPVERGLDPVEDGQADFVLMHPDHGVLVVEVKGGFIEADRGHWTSTNAEGVHDIKDPFKQVTRIKFGLLEQFRKRFGLDPWLMHAVAFPDTTSADGPIGLHDPDIVMFKGDLQTAARAIVRVIEAHRPRPQNLSAIRLEKIACQLAPTVSIRPTLADAAGKVKDELLTLTQQQQSVLQLTRSLNRVWISGGAGTGKTVLAVEKARQLADDGSKVMLLCFNQPLGEYLGGQVQDLPNITAGNYHRVAIELGHLSRPPDVGEETWLATGFDEAFFDICVAENSTWDAVIIDEGQDFRSEWLETLEQVLAGPESRLFLFADENQNLFRGAGVAGLPTRPLHLDVNCRNTPQINRRATESIGINMACLPRNDGLEPTLTIEKDAAALLRRLRSSLHRLVVTEGVNVEDVAVLSPSRSLISELQGTRIGRWNAVGPFESGLVCETVQRFKGLEADAVLLLLPDDGPLDKMLAYVGMSRARAVLEVIAMPASANVLTWPE